MHLKENIPLREWKCLGSQCLYHGHDAKNGHLECLKYARENVCKLIKSKRIGVSACDYRVKRGKIECMKYANENGDESHLYSP